MKKLVLFIVLLVSPFQLMAAEATVEVCLSVTDITDPGPGAISGFPETCFSMNRSLEIDEEIDGIQQSRTLRESVTHLFPYGGCNTSGAPLDYDIEVAWSYSIQTEVFSEERATAWVQRPGLPRIYRGAEESFTEQSSGTFPDGVCGDFRMTFTIGVELVVGDSEFTLDNVSGLNGLFFDQDNPGHGFDFNVLQEGGMVIYYYGHTADGERLWLVSEFYSDFLFFFGPIELEMFEVGEGSFGSPVLPERKWGTLTIEMANCEEGTATLVGDDGELVMSITRLAFISGLGCY